MDCVNHSGVNATAFCQNCGKALCEACARRMEGGQVMCETCLAAWQNMQQAFVPPPPGGPNPVAAAVLGLIPGVGAMFNGQFFKGLIHVVIFALLINMTTHFGIFGIFIAAWVLYQSFEAYHTAVARRDGLPLPDPLGLNEVGNWLNVSGRSHHAGQPPAVPVNPMQPGPGQGPAAGGYQTPYAGPYQAPYGGPQQSFTQGGYGEPGAPPVPPAPPMPPVPPVSWRRREPIGAMILIGFGVLLLLNQMGFEVDRFFHVLWPLVLIAVGVWLIMRRMGDARKGGAQ